MKITHLFFLLYLQVFFLLHHQHAQSQNHTSRVFCQKFLIVLVLIKKRSFKGGFKERESIDKKKEESKREIQALELEEKILEINLQEARATRDDNKINATLAQIMQQEVKILQKISKEK